MSGVHINRTRRKGVPGKEYPRLTRKPVRGRYVHTLVAEAMMGRELREGECVDHRDDNGQNPQPWNLRVMTVIGNSRRKGQPPLKGEVIFDGAVWWAMHNPDWVDPLGLVSGQEISRERGEPVAAENSPFIDRTASCPDEFCTVGSTESEVRMEAL